MLALFGQGNQTKSPKQEDTGFDISSFLTKATPPSKDKKKPELQKKETISNLLDVTEELKKEKPVLSRTAQKLIEKVHNETEKRTKDVIKANKKIYQSIKQHIPEAIKDNKKPSPRPGTVLNKENKPIKKREDSELKKKLLEFSRNYDEYQNDPDKLKQFENLLNLERRRLSGKPVDNNDNNNPKQSEDNFKIKSKKENFNKEKETPRKEQYQSKPKIKESVKHKSSDSRPMKPKNYEDYDPLTTSSASKPKEKKSSSTHEQYDPLAVSVKRDKKPEFSSKPNYSSKPDYNSKPNYSSKPGYSSKPDISSKKTNQKPPLVRHEPQPAKKTKLSDYEKAQKLKSAFNKPQMKRQQEYESYSDDYSQDDDYDNDSFIDDEDPDVAAQRELSKMMGKHRQKMKMRQHWDEDSSDMEAGFDDIQREEKFSRMVGAKEDEEQFRLIEKERLRELKKKKIQTLNNCLVSTCL